MKVHFQKRVCSIYQSKSWFICQRFKLVNCVWKVIIKHQKFRLMKVASWKFFFISILFLMIHVSEKTRSYSFSLRMSCYLKTLFRHFCWAPYLSFILFLLYFVTDDYSQRFNLSGLADDFIQIFPSLNESLVKYFSPSNRVTRNGRQSSASESGNL